MKLVSRIFIISIIACVILFKSETISAQNKTIDSLKQLVRKTNIDTLKVSLLNDLSEELRIIGNLDESLEYAQNSIELANQTNYNKGKAYALKWAGLVYFDQGDFISVLRLWTESLETFTAIRDTIGMANIIGNIGAVNQKIGNLDIALENYLRSLNLAEKINNYHRIATNLLNIGGIYGELKEFDKALIYFNKMEKYLPRLQDPQMTSYYLTAIGETYRLNKDYDNALKYFKEALQTTKNQTDLPYSLKMLGKIEFEKGNIERAISYLNSSYIKAEDNNQNQDKLSALFELGNVYQKNNPNKALDFYKKAEVLAKEFKLNSDLRDIYKSMFQTYAIKGDFSNAFAYQSQHLILKDSLFNIETDDKIRGIQFDFEIQKKEDEILVFKKEKVITELKAKRQTIMNIAFASLAVFILLLAISYYRRYRLIKKTSNIIQKETDKSEKLLLNILPEETALELKLNGKVQAKKFDSVSVMFTDFKDFTRYSHNLSPEELVNSVDFYYSKFDAIIEKCGLEKIKTIGDSYMCAGGLPFPTKDHAEKIMVAAFEIVEFMERSKKLKDKHISHFDIRVGVNTGPVVAGVVGSKKFAYDIWGDTVNVASRMESTSVPGKINVSEYTYELIKDKYDCEYRGEIYVKNKGMMKMYFVNKLKEKDIIHDPKKEELKL